MIRRTASCYVVVACLGVVLCASPAGLPAQEGTPQEGRGGGQGGLFAGMQRMGGEITAVSGANLTIKGEDGVSYSIVTTDNTRVMKGRGNTVKVADLKAGDGVLAVGNLDAPNKTLHAAMLMATDAAQLKVMRDNLGKTYIAGRVTAIDLDNAKMTVERADRVKQTIGFDETTSFRRGRGRGGLGGGGFGGAPMGGAPDGSPASSPAGNSARSSASTGAPAGESITLADVKVGDMVAGQGALKAGVFVPTQLLVGTPGAGRGPREGRSGAGTVAPPTPGVTGTPVPPPSR